MGVETRHFGTYTFTGHRDLAKTDKNDRKWTSKNVILAHVRSLGFGFKQTRTKMVENERRKTSFWHMYVHWASGFSQNARKFSKNARK